MVIVQVVLAGHLRHTELNAVFAAGEQPLKGVGTLEFDEIVGILLDGLAIHHTAGQAQDFDGKFGVVQNLQCALGSQLTGIIVIVAQHQLLGVAAEESRLLHRQRRAHRGHRVVEAGLMQRHHVQVALAEDDVGALGLFGQIQAVQHAALTVCKCFGGVHILGLGLVQHAAAKAHHIAAHVDNGQHQTVAELVIEAAVFIFHHQACADELRLGKALLGHGREQRIPTVGRGTHTEAHGHGAGDLAAVEIGTHGGALLALQHLVVEPRGGLVQLQHTAAQLLRAVAVILGDGHIDALGQKTDGIGIGEVFDLHHEVDDAAALLAAEAVVDLLVGRDGEGAGLFIVEGAQTKEVGTLARKRNVAAYHIGDIIAGDQLVQKVLRKRHLTTPFPSFACLKRRYTLIY